MAQTEEGGNRATQQLFSIHNFERDLIRRRVVDFSAEPLQQPRMKEDSEEIELSLGLSLNGRFGVDPRSKLQQLKRSSSIADFSPSMISSTTENENKGRNFHVPAPCMMPIMRTCSLPTETEEEWRKRKELQSLRRMEAKRKRSEKQQRSYNNISNNSKMLVRERSRDNLEKESVNGSIIHRQGSQGMSNWVSGGNCHHLPPLPPPESQATIGSQGSGSSGITETDIPSAEGSNVDPSSNSELRVPQMSTTPEKSGQLNGGVQIQNQCNKSRSPSKGTKEIVRNVLENMPGVSTKGEGPDGKRIDGFLYHKKGEEVRIVCVCHGSFLTPAEFVKHAGGGDVLHPLKHIVVNPSVIL